MWKFRGRSNRTSIVKFLSWPSSGSASTTTSTDSPAGISRDETLGSAHPQLELIRAMAAALSVRLWTRYRTGTRFFPPSFKACESTTIVLNEGEPSINARSIGEDRSLPHRVSVGAATIAGAMADITRIHDPCRWRGLSRVVLRPVHARSASDKRPTAMHEAGNHDRLRRSSPPGRHSSEVAMWRAIPSQRSQSLLSEIHVGGLGKSRI